MRLREFAKELLKESDLPGWLSSAQGFEIIDDFNRWVKAVVGKGAEEYRTDPKSGKKVTWFTPDAKTIGIGAYEEDGETVHGFWYGEKQFGVVLDEPAISTDPMTGNFSGLPPAFDSSGWLKAD